jgi:uncharacterized protein (TIGR02145 family)
MKKVILFWVIIMSFLFNSCNKEEEEYIFNKSEPVIDVDDNTYHTVTIGTQVWLVENLNVTHYRNGDPISIVTDENQWSDLSKGAYCDYNNKSSNSTIYGRLYNWYAVNDSRNIAPIGWRVATDEDWKILTTYLGGESYNDNIPTTIEEIGIILKESGTTHWNYPNNGATNDKGFTALPGGYHPDLVNYPFLGIGNVGYWWTSTDASDYTHGAWARSLSYDSKNVGRIRSSKNCGYSVRCLLN